MSDVGRCRVCKVWMFKLRESRVKYVQLNSTYHKQVEVESLFGRGEGQNECSAASYSTIFDRIYDWMGYFMYVYLCMRRQMAILFMRSNSFFLLDAATMNRNCRFWIRWHSCVCVMKEVTLPSSHVCIAICGTRHQVDNVIELPAMLSCILHFCVNVNVHWLSNDSFVWWTNEGGLSEVARWEASSGESDGISSIFS